MQGGYLCLWQLASRLEPLGFGFDATKVKAKGKLMYYFGSSNLQLDLDLATCTRSSIVIYLLRSSKQDEEDRSLNKIDIPV